MLYNATNKNKLLLSTEVPANKTARQTRPS